MIITKRFPVWLLAALAITFLPSPWQTTSASWRGVEFQNIVATPSDELLLRAGSRPPPRKKAKTQKAPKSSAKKSGPRRKKGRAAKPKKQYIGVSKVRKNLKAAKTQNIRVSKAPKTSLSNKTKAEVRKALGQLRSQLLPATKPSSEFNKKSFAGIEKRFDRVVAHARAYKGPKVMIGKHYDKVDLKEKGSKESYMKRFSFDKGALSAGMKYHNIPLNKNGVPGTISANKWKKMTEEQKDKWYWSSNRNFLRNAVKKNARVYLAVPKRLADGPRPGIKESFNNASGAKKIKDSFFKKEIKFLEKKGYKMSKDGLYMYK